MCSTISASWWLTDGMSISAAVAASRSGTGTSPDYGSPCPLGSPAVLIACCRYRVRRDRRDRHLLDPGRRHGLRPGPPDRGRTEIGRAWRGEGVVTYV